jgi:SSS family solute:Na+ symporter
VAGTIVWFVLGNPWGIDNIYIALFTPAIVMVLDHVIRRSKPAVGMGAGAGR